MSQSGSEPTAVVAGPDHAKIVDLETLGLSTTAAPRATSTDEVPWHLSYRDGFVELRVVRLLEERLSDPVNAPVLLACGGVLENLRIALNAKGLGGDVTLFPDPDDEDLLARLRSGEARQAGREEQALYSVLARAAEGLPAEEFPGGDHTLGVGRLAPAQLAVFHHAARSRGCWIDLITDDVRRAMLADLVARAETFAEAARGSRPLFALFASEPAREDPLIAREPFGLDRLFRLLGANVSPTPPTSRLPKSWAGTAVMHAALLAIMGSADDTPKDWLYAGAAIQRVLLHATLQNLVAGFFVETIRHPVYRDQLRSVLFAAGQPHAVVRFEALPAPLPA